jgi:hypothetical protein
LFGLTPEYIRRRLREFVLDGGVIEQVREGRSHFRHRDYWYKAIVPEPGFELGLFIELELTEEDPELPCVTLWNAHPQRS